MPETYPVLEPKGSQGELSSSTGAETALSEEEFTPAGDFSQELKVLWFGWINQDIWLFKLVCDRHYRSCINVAISLLSTGESVWGMCFPTTQKFDFKNTLFCRLSLMTIFPHTSIRQQHMPAFLP